MDAYILHIREEYAPENKWSIKNKYSAWCTEKQAFNEIKKYLEAPAFRSPFYEQEILIKSALALLNAEQYNDVLLIINEYSKATTPDKNGYKSAKITLTVTKSTFRGSVFE